MTKHRNAFIEKLRETPPDTEVSASSSLGKAYRFTTASHRLVKSWDALLADHDKLAAEVIRLRQVNQTLTNQLINNEVPF